MFATKRKAQPLACAVFDPMHTVTFALLSPLILPGAISRGLWRIVYR